MNERALNQFLTTQIEDGKKLLKKEKGPKMTFSKELSNKVLIWQASCTEALELKLKGGSPLLKIYQDLWNTEKKENKREQVEQTVAILEKSIQLGKIYEEVRKEEKPAPEISIEREVKLLIGTILPKTPWFYVPLIALIGAITFALFGVIRIQDLEVDVNQQATAAMQHARSRIDSVAVGAQRSIAVAGESAEEIIREARVEVGQKLNERLEKHVQTEEDRITSTANRQINTIIEETTPDLLPAVDSIRSIVVRLDGQTSLIDERVKESDSILSIISKEIPTLRKALDEIASVKDRNQLRLLSDALYIQEWWIYVALVSGISLFVAVIHLMIKAHWK